MSFKIPSGKVIAWDTETTGLFWRNGDRPYCFSFCNEKGETAVVSFPVDPRTRYVLYNAYKDYDKLQQFFSDPTITKIAHNAQFDVGMTKAAGFTLKGEIICTMNLIRLVRSDAPMKLKEFCAAYLGISKDDETDLKEATRKARRLGKQQGYKIYEGGGTEDGQLAPDYWLAPRDILEKYALTDAARCMAVYLTLMPELKKLKLEELWEQEKKTWKVLRAIEKRGIRIYREKVIAHKYALKKKLQIYQKQALQIAGPKVNLNSHIQLKKIFYEKLNEPTKYLTPTGSPSTDVDALRNMKHPLAKMILNMRACQKTVEFMDQYIDYMVEKNGIWKIHPIIHQSRAITGRESCSDPNLQQVASGRNDKGIEITVEARSVFGPSPGYQLRSYDWKNIEVFIPAFKSHEPALTEVLRKGGDVHQNTADYLSGITGNKISRDMAKRIFFGLLYGIGGKKLAKLLLLEEETAYQVVAAFHKKYPVLSMWMEGLKNEAAVNGYIKTAYGRIIRFDRRETYKAPNYYVQGTAGGILRNAKIKIWKKFKEKKLDAYIVLPIHDEVLVEIGENEDVSLVDALVVAAMQDNPELKMPIPIPVSISVIGKNWAEKTKI